MEFATFLAAIVVMAAPLVLASLGETLTEKAGVVNLSLDGTILLGAMTGFAVASLTKSLLFGFLAALLFEALLQVDGNDLLHDPIQPVLGRQRALDGDQLSVDAKNDGSANLQMHV